MSKKKAKRNRRDDLVAAALEAFVDRGYEGTSVADLADATNLSKAAFVYHFDSKEELLFELSEPLLDELDAVVDYYEVKESDPSTFLGEYLEALCRHHQVASWIDGDKSVLNHGDLGSRLDTNNRRVHMLLTGADPSEVNQARASAILGMMWRPVRNGFLTSNAETKAAILELATSAASALGVDKSGV